MAQPDAGGEKNFDWYVSARRVPAPVL